MRCYRIDNLAPVVDPTLYVHRTAVLIGDVIVGPGCYAGPVASLGGDFGRIVLEAGSNVQDTCVIHCFPASDTRVGRDGHIGHGAVLHGCDVGEDVLVGMNAVVMDDARTGPRSFVAAIAEVAWKQAGTRRISGAGQAMPGRYGRVRTHDDTPLRTAAKD